MKELILKNIRKILGKKLCCKYLDKRHMIEHSSLIKHTDVSNHSKITHTYLCKRCDSVIVKHYKM